MREFLRSETAGGGLLIAAAFVAMVLANSPWAAHYFHALHIKIGPFTLQHWINDGLMALFFFLVGLEIKREWLDGHLSTWADRRLPILAAAAGMITPALIYLAFAGGGGAARGWAIPTATDIAFALAVISLLGKRVPTSLKLFLTTVAIVDDMGAVAIIAIAYTKAINGAALLAALVIMGGLAALNTWRVTHPLVYVLGFMALWFAVLQSGVHATIAGVLAAIFVPLRVTKAAPDAEDSTLHRIEHRLNRPVALGVMPLFGFANAGVSLASADPLAPIPLAVALGLFFGKQIGIAGVIWGSTKLGLAAKPKGVSWAQLYGVALLCGIGFTMSLFIGGLAFPDAVRQDAAKIGILIGSGLSALFGYALLAFHKSPKLK